MRAEAARRRAWRAGWRAETLCVLALRLKGYRILARRFRSRAGEIDIVARRGTTLAIVEVKARPTLEAALQALGTHQRRRLERAALAFLSRQASGAVPRSGMSLRFDIMLVTPWRWPRHVENAWQADPDRKRGTW